MGPGGARGDPIEEGSGAVLPAALLPAAPQSAQCALPVPAARSSSSSRFLLRSRSPMASPAGGRAQRGSAGRSPDPRAPMASALARQVERGAGPAPPAPRAPASPAPPRPAVPLLPPRDCLPAPRAPLPPRRDQARREPSARLGVPLAPDQIPARHLLAKPTSSPPLRLRAQPLEGK